MLINGWLSLVNNDLCAFLEAIDVELNPEVAELVCKAVFDRSTKCPIA
jgi:hypothetical protein